MCAAGGITNILKPIHKLHDPLDLDNKLLDKLGLPSVAGKKNGLFPDLVNDSTDDQKDVDYQPPAAENVAGDVQAARDSEKRRRAAAAGMSSTILGGGGSASTSIKTLLGQ